MHIRAANLKGKAEMQKYVVSLCFWREIQHISAILLYLLDLPLLYHKLWLHDTERNVNILLHAFADDAA